MSLGVKNPRSSFRSSSTGLTLVIKIGTSSICDEATLFPKLSTLSLLVETVRTLRSQGHSVVIVSSGAVGVGLKRLNLDRRPKHLPQVQAVAAVGQGRLMALYDDLFGRFDIPIAQILLTRDNLAERSQYLNACNTFKELMAMNVVPIVNENDTVSNAEIRFGDNDTLGAITAGMINADYLFLCTDVECLYTDNPRTNPDAKPVRVVEDIAKLREEVNVASPGSSFGTGGMVTKLIAADLATAAGCATIITLGSKPQLIISILDEVVAHFGSRSKSASLTEGGGDSASSSTTKSASQFNPTMGTHFLPKPNPMLDRKWWILHGLAAHGSIHLDAGAVRALAVQKSSLFAAGVVKVEGNFASNQCVKFVTSAANIAALSAASGAAGTTLSGVLAQYANQDPDSIVEVGKGIVNYTSVEIQRIKGCKSSEIEDVLGYVDTEFVSHRDSIAITLFGGNKET